MKIPIPRLMISASQKSSGKTLVSLGIMHSLVHEGIGVNSFKKGPDYIDPMWHKLVTGRECRNLDPFLMGPEACLDSFLGNSDENSFSLIEGNHGFHDGMDIDGSDSSAGLARLLQAPVLLVVDSRKMNRGAAAIVKGMQSMPPEADIAGVILNQVQGPRQEEKQRKAVEQLCHVPVLGAIPKDEELVITERQLGLTTVGETADAETVIRKAGQKVAECCDLHAIRSLFRRAPSMESREKREKKRATAVQATIGVFRDPSFCFYYPENLEALQDNGAGLVFVNALKDVGLPVVDGLYLGGGFPESFFEELSGNKGLLKEVKDAVLSGMPLYAECGGLIYLCKSARYEGKIYPLADILPLEIGFQRKPVGHGYLDLRSRCDSPWFAKDEKVRAHEFHYSKPRNSGEQVAYQFDLVRGFGVTGQRDGVLSGNLFASFAHLHAIGNPNWGKRFVALASEYHAKKSITG
ncbi:MAG: hydrogenobyrinic acid a,c-diamide synthase (glutamine-hydrolyzing) [Chlorobiales bacterium]|nr:hydrogenobyrinic acid a,c-diamide synthase (glutamine-hydrolyzing) [Chlorobiales bacterium]